MIVIDTGFGTGWVMARLLTAFGGLVVASAIMGSPVAAQTQPLASAPAPKIFTDVTQCRTIADNAERLACFDRSVGTLATAQANKEVYVADKEAISEARKGLFGFNLPKLRIFSDDDMEKDVSSIESTIAAFNEGPRGYVFTLKDGGRWRQTDSAYMDRPKAGAPIRIRRAALGSFFGSISGQPGFRIERVN
ncbi:MAG: hypothetical protein V4696_14305 [Pseudomonadota bacterium]